MNPLVSIIIPAYNVEKYIDECIESCVSQTYNNLEIIIVDDGSTDLTSQIVDNWAKRDKRIRVFHKENGGLPDARNYGMKNYLGDLLLLLDADDMLYIDSVSILVHGWDGSSTTIVGGGYIRFCSSNEIKKHSDHSVCFTEKITKKSFLKKRKGYFCWGILFPKSLLSKNDLYFDDSMKKLEDVVWMSIVFLYVNSFIYCNESVYKYRITPKSITSSFSDVPTLVGWWIRAARAIKNNSKIRKLTFIQRKEIKKRIRMCKNNIYAELVQAKYRVKNYDNIYRDFTNYPLPLHSRIEFFLYYLLFKIKSFLSHR